MIPRNRRAATPSIPCCTVAAVETLARPDLFAPDPLPATTADVQQTPQTAKYATKLAPTLAAQSAKKVNASWTAIRVLLTAIPIPSTAAKPNPLTKPAPDLPSPKSSPYPGMYRCLYPNLFIHPIGFSARVWLLVLSALAMKTPPHIYRLPPTHRPTPTHLLFPQTHR